MADTIFEELRTDHDTQRRLAELTAKTEGDSDGRRELFDRLVKELERHADAEEKFFYSELLKHELTRDKARHSVAEHKELDDRIAELQETDLSSPAWLPRFKDLAHRVEHHLAEEEREVFQPAGKVLNDDEKIRLGSAYRQMMEA